MPKPAVRTGTIEIKAYTEFRQEEIVHLYQSVGWTNYLKRADTLRAAYENSLCVFAAFDAGKLIGIIRAVGDGISIVLIQDVIVLPEYQRKGVGTALLKTVMDKYKDVYQLELLTDNTEKTTAFYRSAGFAAADEIGCRTFIKM